MRIISGLYGGRHLKNPTDRKTRPTSDRLRETLFNILTPKISPVTNFLDLCAGTGAIGIEALSRGCSNAVFIDKSRRACGLIERNLDHLQVPENQTEVFCSPAEKFLARNSERTWDIIFFDPPYSEDYAPVMRLLGQPGSKLLSDEGVLVVEHHSKKTLPDEIDLIRRWRILRQGESTLSFYEKG